MASRGTYRAAFTCLVDDPDFQRLHPHAKLVFWTARMSQDAGIGCIFRYYPEKIAKQTRLAVRAVVDALDELEQNSWAYHDDIILWLRNGLRHDPTISLAHPGHRVAVLKAIAGLPHRPLVLKFCDYYQLPYPPGWDPSAIRVGVDRDESPPRIHIAPPQEQEQEQETTVSGLPTRPPSARDLAKGILDFLNEKAGRAFRPTEPNLQFIEARLRSGASEQDCRSVIARKVRAWRGDPKMAPYLRPATLFNATKFEQYVGERDA